MKIAFIFPGQGSQYVGMGNKLSNSSNAAQQVFEQANKVLGWDVASLCWNGPEEKLNQTEYTQPALLTTEYAVLAALEEKGVRPDVVAGHSLGEYTALVASGGVSFKEALLLVQSRGRFMRNAIEPGQGSMAAILGLSRDEVEAVCVTISSSPKLLGKVGTANINSPVQIVIAGEKQAVEEASALARQRGAKRIVPLNVSVPSHCHLMKPAAEALATEFHKVNFKELEIPLVANVNGQIIKKPIEMKESLAQQLASPVLWVDVIEKIQAGGAEVFVEVGPGKVLSGLVRRILPKARILNVEDPPSLEKTVEALRAQG